MVINAQSNTDDARLPWLTAGYALFAEEGPKGLKVEVLARRCYKSKSSFYHFFVDMAAFTEALLDFHFARAKAMIAAERACQNLVPDLLNVILAHKDDLLFNRQLRVNRQNPQFKRCFEKINAESADVILTIWAEALGLNQQTQLARLLLGLIIENFFLQVVEENFNREWIAQYFQEIIYVIKGLKNSGQI